MTVEALKLPHEFIVNGDASYFLSTESWGAASIIVSLSTDNRATWQVQTIGTHYTITPEGLTYDGFEVVPLVEWPDGAALHIARDTSKEQEFSAPENARGFETALDRLMMIAQDQDRKLSQTLRVSAQSAAPPPLPSVEDRSGRVLAFDIQGNPVAGQTLGSLDLLIARSSQNLAVTDGQMPSFRTMTIAIAAMAEDSQRAERLYKPGTVVMIDGALTPGTGFCIARVEETDNPYYPFGGPLRPIFWIDIQAWGVITDGVHDFETDTLSGTDNADALQRASNFAMLYGYELVLPGRMFFSAEHVWWQHDATFNPLPDTRPNAYSNFTVRGAGSGSVVYSRRAGITAPSVSTLLLAPGKVVKSSQGFSRKMGGFEVRGTRPPNEALIAFGRAFIQGGRLLDVTVVDLNTTTVPGAACEITATFYADFSQQKVLAGGSASDRYDDITARGNEIGVGLGQWFRSDGSGSLGHYRGGFVTGHEDGIWVGDPFGQSDTTNVISDLTLELSSVSKCYRGLSAGGGVDKLNILRMHGEFCSGYTVGAFEGIEQMNIIGGSSNAPRRHGDDDDYTLDEGYAKACIYIDQRVGGVLVQDHDFNFQTVPGLLYRAVAGEVPTRIVVRGVQASAQGGPMIGILNEGGDVDIVLEDPYGDVSAAKLIGYVSRNSDFDPYTFQAAPHLAQIINAPADFSVNLNADTDLTGVRSLPKRLLTTTLSNNVTVTLGDQSKHDDLTYIKRNSQNALRIQAAAGLSLIYRGSTIGSGDVTPYVEMTDPGRMNITYLGNRAYIETQDA